MANSNVHQWAVPGGKNGGNSHLFNVVDSDAFPWAFRPDLVYAQVLTYQQIRDLAMVSQGDEVTVGGTIVAGDHSLTFSNTQTGEEYITLTHTVHEDTVTIGGTASDGNYDTVFDQLDPPVRVRTVRSTTPATNANIATQHAADITDLIATSLAGIVASASANSAVVTIVYEAGIDPQTLTCSETTATGTITASVGEDEDDIAAALEALIEDARDTDEPLEGIVEGETVSTDTITIDYVDGVQVTLTADFPGTSTATIVADVVGTIALGVVGDYFPSNVWLNGGGVHVTTAFTGITTLTAELGGTFLSSGTPDPDGLMTSSDLTATGFLQTIAAAEYVEHMETAFSPTLTITADEPLSNLTAGALVVQMRYSPPPTI